jgi:hypothetical protein
MHLFSPSSAGPCIQARLRKNLRWLCVLCEREVFLFTLFVAPLRRGVRNIFWFFLFYWTRTCAESHQVASGAPSALSSTAKKKTQFPAGKVALDTSKGGDREKMGAATHL